MLTGSHRPGPCIILYMTNTWEMSFKNTESRFRDRSYANFPSEGGVNLLQEGQFHIPLSANLPTAQRQIPKLSFHEGRKALFMSKCTLQAVSGKRCLLPCDPEVLDYNRLSA